MGEVVLDDPAARDLRDGLQQMTGKPVELRSTHVSWVFLTGDRAYKLKRPVRHAFVDQSTPQLRRALCEQEVAANKTLAADVVLGVRGVLPAGSDTVLSDPDDPRAVDWVIEMRRFDEALTMASRLQRASLRADHIDRAARALAAFHGSASVPGAGLAAAARERFDVNLAELQAAMPEPIDEPRLAAFTALAEGFTRVRAAQFERRAGAGLVVDGHGDLRAEHVLIEDDGVRFVDRLEFDPALRRIDAADDIAFLVMDLISIGGEWVADRLITTYRQAGGDPGDDALIAFYATYRAQVRAKVAYLRGDVPRGDALLQLSSRLAWQARCPVLLLVTGPPASGKSTLARALARASGVPVMSSDRARKAALGIEPQQSAPAEAYAGVRRAAVYRELAAQAAAALATGHGGVIVDATFGDGALQEAFFAALPPAATDLIRVVECHAPAAVIEQRAALRARSRESAAGSDAGPEIAMRLAASFEGIRHPGVPVFSADTSADPSVLADRIAAWLGERLPAPAV